MEANSYHANPLAKSIFLNVNLLAEANRAEQGMCSFPVENLIEALLIGTSFNLEKANLAMERKDELLKYLLGYPDHITGHQVYNAGDWKQFSFYNTGACKYMAIRSEFVVSLMNDYKDLFIEAQNPNIKKHHLEKISQHPMAITYPNIAWSIKILALRKNWKDFEGIQANTSPCRKATEFLFGKSFNGDQFGHTMLCHKIAIETGLSVMNANSVLWAMGCKL